MHNLRHFYYQNKEKIWKVVLIIALILGIIYFLNYLTTRENSQNNITQTTPNSFYADEENKTYISSQSAISGDTITEQDVKIINDTISQFLQYCKNGSSEQAYNMLSSDCKENEYNTLEKFQTLYISTKFNKNSIYEIERWINDTYQISISDDLLSTGKVNSNSKRIEYITIVKENSEPKLNVNSLVQKKDINKPVEQNSIKIEAVSKRIYMDYEIYDFTVENLSQNTIKLDSLNKIGTMYIKDANGNKYNALTNEILDEILEIRSNHKLNISIKYAKSYSSKNEINNITFENIILDYIKYKTTNNLEEFKDIGKITINL